MAYYKCKEKVLFVHIPAQVEFLVNQMCRQNSLGSVDSRLYLLP